MSENTEGVLKIKLGELRFLNALMNENEYSYVFNSNKY
jgi:hypothetical protein